MMTLAETIPLDALQSVRLLKDAEAVRVHYMATDLEFRLELDTPVHIMHTLSDNDDATCVEVIDSNIVAVQQVTEAGETQTVMLSPKMAIELARLLNSFVFFPIGLNAE